MSRMGQKVFEIQEMYDNGFTLEAIISVSGVTRDFVMAVLDDYSRQRSEPDFFDYPDDNYQYF